MISDIRKAGLLGYGASKRENRRWGTLIFFLKDTAQKLEINDSDTSIAPLHHMSHSNQIFTWNKKFKSKVLFLSSTSPIMCTAKYRKQFRLTVVFLSILLKKFRYFTKTYCFRPHDSFPDTFQDQYIDPERRKLIPQPHLPHVFPVCNSQEVITNLELSVQKQLQKVEELTNDPVVLSKKNTTRAQV